MKNKTFSIATLNLCNFNEPGKPVYGAKGLSQAEYDAKAEWTARQVAIMDADVFCFQELWSGKCLDDFMKRSGKDGQYDRILRPGTDGNEIACAAIVRKGLLVDEPEWISAFPEGMRLSSSGADRQTPAISVDIPGFSRPVLRFSVRPNEGKEPIQVFVIHFKSKMATEVSGEAWFKERPEFYKPHAAAIGSTLSTIRRTAEAAALRMILTEATKGGDAPVIVLGDMNDDTYSNTANIVTQQPSYISGTGLGGSDTALYSVQTLQEYRDSRDVYYTYVHQGFRESLDQIFVSQELYDHSRKRVWLFTEMIVDNDHLNFPDHKGLGTSDHGVIKATFKLP